MTYKEAKDLLAMKNADPSYELLPEDYYGELINRGQEFVAECTHCIFTIFTHDSVKDQADYNLADCPTTSADRVFKVLNVIYDNDRLRIENLTQRDMESSSWRTASSGTPKRALIQGDWFILDPPPDTSAKEIRVEVVRRPDVMTDDSDVLQIRSEYFDDLIAYCLACLTPNMSGIYTFRELLKGKCSQELNRAVTKFSNPRAGKTDKFI